jgi:hypothetical protein
VYPGGARLLAALRQPDSVLALDAAGWNDLLDCAQRHRLLARLDWEISAAGLADRAPATARDLLADARARAELNQTLQRHEVEQVRRVLEGIGVSTILLKGAAYLIADLPPARGRLSGDLDILVPRHALPEVEKAILGQGWQPVVTDPYDQRYYRDWSHQLPPLRHGERRTELDIHHTIAPPTTRVAPNTAALLADARPAGDGRVSILAPPDMVLHSAVHLFNEDLTMGMRDLLDMHDLLEHFGADDAFWPALARRASIHRMERPLFYCARFCSRLLGTRIPAAVQADLNVAAPNRLARAAMDLSVPMALILERPDRAAPRADLARWLLYARSHWLRMPPAMLAKHLLVKAVRRSGAGAGTKPSPTP